MVNRGQAFTLEAVAAAVLLVASIVFALQMTAVTPLTASISSQHVENQQAGLAQGVLDGAAENGTLKSTLLYWNDSGGRFYGAADVGYYPSGGPDTAFGEQLETVLEPHGVAYNVNVRYINDRDHPRTIRMIHRGSPSDNAVRVTKTVTVFEDDVLYDKDEEPTSVEVTESDRFYAPNIDEDRYVYNVIQVEVVVWRM